MISKLLYRLFKKDEAMLIAAETYEAALAAPRPVMPDEEFQLMLTNTGYALDAGLPLAIAHDMIKNAGPFFCAIDRKRLILRLYASALYQEPASLEQYAAIVREKGHSFTAKQRQQMNDLKESHRLLREGDLKLNQGVSP